MRIWLTLISHHVFSKIEQKIKRGYTLKSTYPIHTQIKKTDTTVGLFYNFTLLE